VGRACPILRKKSAWIKRLLPQLPATDLDHVLVGRHGRSLAGSSPSLLSTTISASWRAHSPTIAVFFLIPISTLLLWWASHPFGTPSDRALVKNRINPNSEVEVGNSGSSGASPRSQSPDWERTCPRNSVSQRVDVLARGLRSWCRRHRKPGETEFPRHLRLLQNSVRENVNK